MCVKIAVVAPSNALSREAAEEVQAIAVGARRLRPVRSTRNASSPHGHFAGTDAERLAALREVMADPTVDAVWFARGGYGSNRIAEAAARDLPAAARSKIFMGYSDAGFLLAALHKAGLAGRARADAAGHACATAAKRRSHRALDWLVRRDPASARARAPAAGDGVQPDRPVEAARDRRSSPTSPASSC